MKSIEDDNQADFNQLYDVLPTIAILDANGVIIDTNRSWREFGRENGLERDSIGDNYIAICEGASGDDTEGASEAATGIRAVLRGDLPEYTLEYPCHAPHEQRWFQMRVRYLPDTGGAVVIHENITLLKLAEMRRFELALEREKNELMRQVIDSLSHDLRTPLTIMNLTLDNLKRMPVQPSDLDTLREQTQRIERAFALLLEMFALDTKSRRLLTMPFRVSSLLEKLYAEHQSLASKKGIDLLYPASDPVVINGDQQLLDAAIARILENAIFYTPTGGKVTLRHVPNGRETVSIEVEDTGIGIAAEKLPHIFDPFFRADNARHSSTGGTGLGLPFAKKVIVMHGGSIRVESQPQVGSIFTLTLPVR